MTRYLKRATKAPARFVVEVVAYDRLCLLLPGAMLGACVLGGCAPCGLTRGFLILEAQIVDDGTGTAISNASIGGSLFTADEETSYRDPQGPVGTGDMLPPDAEGQFRLAFGAPELGSVCGVPPFQRIIESEFPTPDLLELIVVRDGCEQRLTVDLNEDTVVDMSFPDNVLELKEAILVPACEGETQP